MARVVCLILLAVPVMAGAAPLGPWGEDPSKVPSFALAQERRAPKLYANKEIYRELPAHEAPVLEDALLVCHASFEHKSWDTFAGPDITFRFTFRKEHPIRLWGPEDHFDFFVSIPRVRLASGDPIEVAAWDRDVTKEEYIGQGRTRYDGRLPLRIDGQHFTLDCNAMTMEEALRRAAPHLAEIDRRLGAMEAARPDPAQWDYRPPTEAARLRGMFYTGTLRYAAGFVGWDHPEVQSRLARLTAAEAAWKERRDEAARTLLASARSAGESLRAGSGSLRVERYVCGQRAREPLAAFPTAKHKCVIDLAVTAHQDRPLSCGEQQLAVLDPRGDFHAVEALCPASRELASGDHLLLGLGEGDFSVLWLSDGRTAQVVRLP